MNDNIVLRVIVRLLLPFIIMYGLYIQFHGELSAGGGFQSGVIIAAGFIVYSFAYDFYSLQRIIPPFVIKILASVGVFIYGAVGVVSLTMGGRFLDYSVLMNDKIASQKLGVMLVELGVGLTVFSVIMMIFYAFGERSGDA